MSEPRFLTRFFPLLAVAGSAVTLTLLLFAYGIPSVSASVAAAAWNAPVDAAKRNNPLVAPSAEALAAGKKVFTRQCMSCHGTLGKGDGPAAADQPVKPHDLTSPAVLKQTDGELFWKITTGRKPMLSFEKLLTEEQRWQVILYIRTLKKK